MAVCSKVWASEILQTGLSNARTKLWMAGENMTFIDCSLNSIFELSSWLQISIRIYIHFITPWLSRSCELLSLLLEELELENAALHSLKSQSSRLSALHQFKSGRVSVLIATDVANRGLDIPTVDLVLNYDVPR